MVAQLSKAIDSAELLSYEYDDGMVDVADSAVKIGLGAISGGLLAISLEQMRQGHERKRSRDQIRKEAIVQPIVTFLDELMAAMGEVYWTRFEGKEPQIGDRMVILRQREGAIEARVAALRNAELSAKWNQLTPKLAKVRERLNDRQIGDPRVKMHEAFALEGDILRILFEF
jgi:hypothetical protein